MKQFKSFICGFLVCGILFSSISVAFAKTEQIEALFENIKIKINGKLIDTGEDKPFIFNGRTYVPARYVAQELGATVKWNETDNIVEIDSIKTSSTTPTNSDSDISDNRVYPEFEKDGYNIISVNGIEYISTDEIFYKHPRYSVRWYPDHTYSLLQQDNSAGVSKGFITILNGMSGYSFNNRLYFEYEYFKSSIKPLLK